ncbi:MAG TPA: hypothetical protein VGI40_24485 [Pirellulaceae bacterium]
MGHVAEQIAERGECELAEALVLPLHKLEIVNLDVAGGKVVVPEQRETFLERVGSEQAAVEPPGFETLGTAGIGGGLANDGGERVEFGRSAGELGLTGEKARNGGFRAIFEVALDLGPGGAEGGAAVEMDDALEVPGGGGRRFVRGPGEHGLKMA